MNRQPYPTDVQDNEWAVLAELMPDAATTGRPRRHSYREIFNAIFYVLCNGIKWRSMPHDLPPWPTVYGYFRRWHLSGHWQKWNKTLRQRLRKRLGRKEEASAGVLDSQSVKTAEGGADRGYDANKRCLGRKRHILVDTLGLLLAVLVTSAKVQDRDGAKALLGAFYGAKSPTAKAAAATLASPCFPPGTCAGPPTAYKTGFAAGSAVWGMSLDTRSFCRIRRDVKAAGAGVPNAR